MSIPRVGPHPQFSPQASSLRPVIDADVRRRIGDQANFTARFDMPVAVWAFDLQTMSIVRANAAALRLWAASSVEELCSRAFDDSNYASRSRMLAYVPLLDSGSDAQDLWVFLPKGVPTVCRTWSRWAVIEPDKRVLLTFAVPDRLEPGAVRGVEALRRTAAMVTLVSLEGEILHANPAAAACYGVERANVGSYASRFVAADTWPRLCEATLSGAGFDEDVQVTAERGVRWHRVIAHASPDPVTGLDSMLVSEVDVTRARDAERELSVANARLGTAVATRTRELHTANVRLRGESELAQAALDAVDALVVGVDRTGAISRMNRAAVELLGSEELLRGRSVEAVLRHVERKWFAQGDPRPLIADRAVGEHPLHSEDGLLQIVWSARWIGDGDAAPFELILTGVDVTERRAMRARLEAQERLASLGTLAAGIAHEINNPLGWIRANVESARTMLQEAQGGAVTGAQMETLLLDILVGCDRVATIVRSLRSFSRQHENDQPVVVDVPATLRSVIAMVRSLARGRTTVVEEIDDRLFIRAIEARLAQVFLNLLVNAVQAMDAGSAGHELRVRARRDGGTVVVEVEDTGPGIPDAVLARIFEPFFTTKPVGEGTGLGLFVCQGITNSLGGEISVESQVGVGTTFRVRLPAVAPPDKPVRRTSSTFPRITLPGTSRILLVDDDPMIRRAMLRLLARHEVAAVDNVDAALEMLRSGERFELILADIQMPEKGGIDLYQAIEAHLPELLPRVRLMTGGVLFDGVVSQLIERVPGLVLSKPLARNDVETVLAVLGPRDLGSQPPSS